MNPIGRDQVTKLYELAREKDRRAQHVLAENITDLFLSGDGRLNEHERMLMTDILYKLVSEFEMIVRKDFAARLLTFPNTPPELLRLLANDAIEIAQPILERSTVLHDADLIEIVRARSDEHRLSIAMRAKLSEEVSDALIEEGSADIVETLLKNQDAEISERAMEYLVAQSRRVDRFQEPLLSRHDLPPRLAYQMFWWVSAALRRRILVDFAEIDKAELDQALQAATVQAIASEGRGGGAYDRAESLVKSLAAQGLLTIKFLTQCLKQQKIPIFVAGLGHLAGISSRTAWRIFSDKGGEGFTVLCRALDTNRSEFASLFLFLTEARVGQTVRSTAVLKESLDLFDAVSVINARAALTYWQWNSAYHQAQEDIGDVGGDVGVTRG